MKILKLSIIFSCLIFSFQVVQAAEKKSGSCQFLTPKQASDKFDMNTGCSTATKESYCPTGTKRDGQVCMCCSTTVGCCSYFQGVLLRANDTLNQAECYKTRDWATMTLYSPNYKAYANACYSPEDYALKIAGKKKYCCEDHSNTHGVVVATYTDTAEECKESCPIGFQTACHPYLGRVVSGNICDEPTEDPVPLAGETKDNKTTNKSYEVDFDYEALPNPLNIKPSDPANSFAEIVGRVIKVFLSILGTITVCMIVYGGWLWMTAQGNDSKIKTSRKILLWAAAGVVLIFMSYVLTKFLFEWLKVG